MNQEREPRVFGNLWAGAADSTGGDGPITDRCRCIEYVLSKRAQGPTRFHPERQDTSAPGWVRLLELIEQAADDGREVFKPLVELTAEQRRQIVTLPPTIAKLKAVKHLVLYRSNLVRIPPQIGEMDSLEEFTPYTSYRLHWFPYEITRCASLRRSTMSTRAVYGNHKYRRSHKRMVPPPPSGSIHCVKFHARRTLRCRYAVDMVLGEGRRRAGNSLLGERQPSTEPRHALHDDGVGTGRRPREVESHS